jgi:hypothetical protein
MSIEYINPPTRCDLCTEPFIYEEGKPARTAAIYFAAFLGTVVGVGIAITFV